MDELRLKNFRCFHEEQVVRLAPLTLLVGENSTGKTSFMALIRALLDLGIGSIVPDFKESPYDLGAFDEIAHHRGARGGQASTFEGGFKASPRIRVGEPNDTALYQFQFTFAKKGSVPSPVRRRLAHGDTWFEENLQAGQRHWFRVGTHRGAWERKVPTRVSARFDFDDTRMQPIFSYLRSSTSEGDPEEDQEFKPLSGSASFSQEDERLLSKLANPQTRIGSRRPFASAPVRLEPRRTYEPARTVSLPEGYYVPMYLANMYFQRKQEWPNLKKRIEDFGKSAGLFDEISIKPAAPCGPAGWRSRLPTAPAGGWGGSH